MEVNSLRYSRIGIRAAASVLAWNASANLCEMVDVAQIFIDSDEQY